MTAFTFTVINTILNEKWVGGGKGWGWRKGYTMSIEQLYLGRFHQFIIPYQKNERTREQETPHTESQCL